MRTSRLVSPLVPCLLVAAARATLVTSAAGFAQPNVVDFEQFSGRNSFVSPVEVSRLPGISVVASATNGASVDIVNSEYLFSNGRWEGREFAFTEGSPLTFTLKGPVSAIGGFVNYIPDNARPLLEALDAQGNVLEGYAIDETDPIRTPGQVNAGAFRGIERANADIVALRISGARFLIDDLTFSPRPVPEPSGLLALGLAALPIALRRRRR